MNNQEKELIDSIYKKFQTTMIGSLARFENSFGHLWEEESERGDKFADMWEYVRNSILNNGNKQARAAIDDLIKFLNKDKVHLNNKINYKFYFDDNQGEQR